MVNKETPRDWVRHPASWMSLIAVAASLGTFWWAHMHPGQLVVLPGWDVGVYLYEDSTMGLLVPVTFSNTSAPRITRHVVTVVATVETANAPPLARHFKWRTEREFVAPDGDDKATLGYLDVPIYKTRAFPFHLAGGTSTSKVLEFRLRSGPQAGELAAGRAIEEFNLVLRVLTLGGQPTERAAYVCDGRRLERAVHWCHRSDEELGL